MTPLIDMNLQIGQIGKNFDGSKYYIFDYAAVLFLGLLPYFKVYF